jgi:hypothetical protein
MMEFVIQVIWLRRHYVISSRSLPSAQSRKRVPSLGLRPSLGRKISNHDLQRSIMTATTSGQVTMNDSGA